MIEDSAITGTDNKIINGNFAVNQRAALFTGSYTAATPILNSDDTYHFDRWYTLSDGNDIIDIASFGRTMGSRSFSPSPSAVMGSLLNSGFATGLDVETANKKFGIAQIVESVNCNDLRGQKCTLSFKARVSDTTKLDNVKAAVVGWFGGTSDTVTSDIISAWGDEGTNPTLIGSAEYQNEPSNLGVTTQWATYKVVTSIAAGAQNVIVFIWSDVTDTDADDFLYLTDVQLERGEFENPRFQNEDYDTTLRKCQRYYWQSGRSAAQYGVAGRGVATAATTGFIQILHGPMRAAGTVAENGTTYMYDGGASTVTAISATYGTVEGTWVFLTASGGGLAAANAIQWEILNTTADWVSVDSEL